MVEPAKRGVGIVFQDYALFPHKTVWQNICFGLFRLDKELREQKAASVMTLTGLTGLEARYPHQLSGGQKQRVALARALAPEPGIILFDEPFSNVDSMRKSQMREDISRILKEAGITSLLVTHDTRDVMFMADRVAVMKDGENLQTDTPANICCMPGNDYIGMCFAQEQKIKTLPF
jgi:iron(III) transport system ATP-binding protein